VVGTEGKHIVFDVWGADKGKLNDVRYIQELLLEAAKLAEATTLHSFFHQFDPDGITGVVVVSESHISIHTWPGEGFASVDVYTCGNKCFPERAVKYITEELEGKCCNVIGIDRGSRPRSLEDMTPAKGGVTTDEKE